MTASVLVLALDGFCNEIYQKVSEKGGFVFLSELMKEGQLHSCNINLCERGWPLIFSGENAGTTNGYYYTLNKQNYNFSESFSMHDYGEMSLWSNTNCKQVVMGVPSTYPPIAVNGIFIAAGAAGHFPIISELALPADLASKYPSLNDDYITDVRSKDFQLSTDYLKKLIDSTNIKTNIACEMIEAEAASLVTVGYVGCDRIAHYFWDNIGSSSNNQVDGLVKDYFLSLDHGIQKLVKLKDWDSVLIVSDHGLTAKKSTLFINKLLINLGYAKAQVSMTGRFKNKIKNIILNKVNAKIRSKLKLITKKVGMLISVPPLDWKETQAFGYYMHGIYINSKEAYSKGIVSGHDYETLVRSIINDLKDIEDENGSLVFTSIMTRQEVFQGSYSKNSPDIVFTVRNGIDVRPDINVDNFIVEFNLDVGGGKYIPNVHSGIHSEAPFVFTYQKDNSISSILSLKDIKKYIEETLRKGI